MNSASTGEVVLAVIPGDCDHHRMVFASRGGQVDKPIILRQESFSPDVGWFPQSSIEMTRQQMVLLRSAMGGSKPAACARTSHRIVASQDKPKHLRLANLPCAS